MFPFYNPLKTAENQRFSNIFRGCSKKFGLKRGNTKNLIKKAVDLIKEVPKLR